MSGEHVLRGVAFPKLDEAQLRSGCRFARTARYRAGQTLFRVGDRDSTFFVSKSGEGVDQSDTPVVAGGHDLILRNPSDRQLAEALGLRRPLRHSLYDLAVVGALANRTTGDGRTIHTPAVFSFIGALPRTDWLPPEIEKDQKAFVRTGPELAHSSQWPLQRQPFLLETRRPGVFAAGDVRSGSIKRVAWAVGEGAMAVQLMHASQVRTFAIGKPLEQGGELCRKRGRMA